MLRSGYVSNGQVVFYEGADRIYQREYAFENISCLSIPDTIVAIQSEAFTGCHELTAISIPDSVKKISTYCFSHCSGLTKVVLPNGLKVIDKDVFKGCTSLKEIIIPDSVTKIAEEAFYECSSLSKVVLPGKLKTIGKDAFYKCPITKVHIPGSVRSLNGFNCTNLEEVIIDEGVEIIGEGGFRECASLTSLTIPESVNTIEHAAFMGCTSLKSLILPKKMAVLEDEVFRGCSQLERIDIPEGVTKIPHLVFVGCTSAHIHFSSTVNEFNVKTEKEDELHWHPDYFNQGYNDIKSISVSADNEVLSMESDCLVDKQKRELLYVLANASAFPANLKSINLQSGFFPPLFDVEELVIPEGVTYLSELPFQKMRKLKKLVLPVSLKKAGSTNLWGISIFFNHYPFSSVAASPDFFLSNRFTRLPMRLDFIGIESVTDELRHKVKERFGALDWLCVYAGGQLIYPAAEVMQAREETISLFRATFDPGGFAFDFDESNQRISVTVFDSLIMHYKLQKDAYGDDLAFLLDVATAYRDALNPYITASSDARIFTKSEWKGYGGTTKYISSEPFPGVHVILKLEQGAVAEAYRALDDLEMAYQVMMSKYGEKVKELV